MNVKLALIADYANITAEGKLNILGIFDRINVASLPAVHPQMQFVLRIEARPAERGRKHAIEIRLHDPNGKTIFEIKGEVVPQGGGPTQTVSSNQILTINNLKIETTGEHTFIVFVDNDLKAEVPLTVREGQPPGGPPEGGPGNGAEGGTETGPTGPPGSAGPPIEA